MTGQRACALASLLGAGALVSLAGCAGKPKSDVELTARTQAVITFSPPSNKKFELRNEGPASVRLFIARNSGNAEMSLSSSGLFVSSLERLGSILVLNETHEPAALKLRVEGKRIDINVEQSPLAGN